MSKTTKYTGTQTEKNLMAAFAGESQARNKYTVQERPPKSAAEPVSVCSKLENRMKTPWVHLLEYT